MSSARWQLMHILLSIKYEQWVFCYILWVQISDLFPFLKCYLRVFIICILKNLYCDVENYNFPLILKFILWLQLFPPNSVSPTSSIYLHTVTNMFIHKIEDKTQWTHIRLSIEGLPPSFLSKLSIIFILIWCISL